jgi:phage I-like protein
VHNYDLQTQPELLPRRIHLLPAGETFEGRDGRKFENTEFEALLAEFHANGMDLPIDIEHSTEVKAPEGEPAPAMGWIKSLSMDADGVWGDVEWNERGKELVESKQYRYISPVFEAEAKTKRVVKLLSAALTNRPNLYLKSLNNRETEITSEVAAMPEDIKEEATIEKNAIVSVEKSVPQFELLQANARAEKAEGLAAELYERLLKVEANYEIDKALRESKINPATEKKYREMCQTQDGLDRFKELMAERQPTVAFDFSRIQEKLAGPKTVELNADERAFCTKYGYSEELYLKTKTANEKRG